MGERFLPRKIFPQDRDNHGPVHHHSDTQKVTTKPLERLVTFVPNQNGRHSIPNGLVRVSPFTLNDRKVPVNGVDVIPLARQPLTPAYKTSIGGVRVGGGGTSREALRRAKRKIKALRTP